MSNPRLENENNSLVAKPIGLIELGLKPIYLDNNHIIDEIELAKKFKRRCQKNRIVAKTKWRI